MLKIVQIDLLKFFYPSNSIWCTESNWAILLVYTSGSAPSDCCGVEFALPRWYATTPINAHTKTAPRIWKDGLKKDDTGTIR